MDPTIVIEQLVQHVAPAVPAILVVAAAYLLGNDILDWLLEVKSARAQLKVGWFSSARLVGFAGFVTAIKSDVWNGRTATLAGGAFVTWFVTGHGDIASLEAALVGVAVANVGSMEISTVAKLKLLLARVSVPKPTPPAAVTPARAAVAAATKTSVKTAPIAPSMAAEDSSVTDLLSPNVEESGATPHQP